VIKRSQLVWPGTVLAILVGAYLLQANGSFARIENAVEEARAAALTHTVDSDIVIVGIDADSLRALSEWPWPRRHHARLLQMLRPAAPKAVFVDIDFSSRSGEDDDAMLERELAQWRDTPLYLAAHFQSRSGLDRSSTVTRPLPRFAQHAELASVILEPGPDGLVRDMRSSWDVDGQTLRSVFAHEATLPPGTVVPIDFSIDETSFAYVSFIDVANGRVDPAALRGKTVYIGPTAIELADIVAVPVYRALPGVVVQAFAAESVRAGPLRPLPEWLSGPLLAVWTLACAYWFGRRGWRSNVALVVVGIGSLAAATLALHVAGRVAFEIAPFALTLVATFVAATVRSLDDQTWRALSLAVGIKRRDALLKSVVDSSTDSIVCIDARGTIRTSNPATARLFGCAHAALSDASLSDFVPSAASDVAMGLESLTGIPLERTAHTTDGRKVPVEITLSRVATEEGLYTAIVRNVSERRAQQRALEHQATHDPLTGLPNRIALSRYLGTLLGTADARRRAALLMLDLSRFKEVNDTLGHDVGDEVLREVARRFSAQLKGQAFISRIGGDEFAVVLADVAAHGAIDELAERLIAGLRAPIEARGIAIEVGVNIGIAVAPDHGVDARELLRHADVAMYSAKRHGAGFEYYDVVDDHHTVRRLGMLSELRTAIDGDGIALHYQPQVNLQTGRAVSVEALLRWRHALHGDVSPTEFVALAEATDLIHPLTYWVIRTVLNDIAVWRERGVALRVAINVSARVLQDVEFPARLAQLLAATTVRPDQIELEITESAMLVDPARAKQIVKALHGLGVLIAIDDYGTGFSSLGYLRDLRVQALKLDKSFIVDLETREQNRVIVESTAQMAHALGLQVVAEGVETKWVEDYLRSVGYDLGQGYLFARPMSAEDCCNWMLRFERAETLPAVPPPARRAAAHTAG
jgi:diguanylate cyclase (GGDEF)-like protein/PAS domain S-box-containing protein